MIVPPCDIAPILRHRGAWMSIRSHLRASRNSAQFSTISRIVSLSKSSFALAIASPPIRQENVDEEFRARTDAKAWTLRERHDPAQPSSSAYLAVYGWVRGTVARGFAAPHMSAFGTKRTCRHVRCLSAFRGKADIGDDARNLVASQ